MSFLKYGSPEKVIGLIQKKSSDSKKKKANKVEDEEEVVKGKKSKLKIYEV